PAVAAVMAPAVASAVFEGNHVIFREPPVRNRGRVDFRAGLFDTTVHVGRLAAPSQHLGHERKPVESTVGIEGCSNLLRRPNDDTISSAKQVFSHSFPKNRAMCAYLATHARVLPASQQLHSR